MIAAAIIAFALPVLPASDANETGSFAVNGYLCESAEYAMDFAAAVASDEEEEFAKNTVGKIAKREVCGRYVGIASIEDQKVIVNDGIIYKLTALRFHEDGKLAWAAERVFAVEGHGSSWRL
jgi:CRISPR/Cas system CMR-associated protein Cmr3 (group 5 of RAMP superfamily)